MLQIKSHVVFALRHRRDVRLNKEKQKRANMTPEERDATNKARREKNASLPEKQKAAINEA